MRALGIIAALGLLAGCGVDGEPLTPAYTTVIGVSNKGVSGGVATTLSNSNVAITIGTGGFF
ncbi:MAG: hypothetical protein AAFQ04_06585 [Pseudomonadota bacterium]